jgi:ribose/xylose/arabinose/galactoside ABC-type transport system permease subunit
MARAVRIAAALAVLAAGAVHLWLYAHDGYSSIHVIGPLFLLNGIAAALIGGALLFSGALLLVLAGIGYALTTLVAFVVSATNGLFGWQEVWSGTPQAVAGFAELLLLPALARAAVRSPSRNRGGVRQ